MTYRFAASYCTNTQVAICTGPVSLYPSIFLSVFSVPGAWREAHVRHSGGDGLNATALRTN